MNSAIQGIILLIKSAITGECYTLPEDFSWESAEALIKKNNAFQICFAGAINCGIAEQLPNFEQMQEDYCIYYMGSQRQLEQADRVFQALGEKGLDYLPIKGCLTKMLYPSHEMRPMGDADVLIHQEQYPKIREVMMELGFQEIPDCSDFDYTWEHPDLKIELHKYLFSPEFSDYFRYFDSIWSRAKEGNHCRWELSIEDTFIYDFTHFAKHFRYGGIGCNHAVDLWVYRRAYPNMDEKYIRQEMEALGMAEFYENICQLLCAWFEDGLWNETTQLLTNLLFGGKWGSSENFRIAQTVKIMQEENTDVKSSRMRHILHLIFPSKKNISLSYPKLTKWPLPFAWIARWIFILLFKRKNIQSQSEKLKHSDEQVLRRKEELESVGIKFSK